MANNILDGGLYIIGTYDSTLNISSLTTNILNVANSTVQVSGVTGFSGTYSNGLTASALKVITVTHGIITNVA